MRQYTRYASDMPIACRRDDNRTRERKYLQNIGQGGLCFYSRARLNKGTVISIEIPVNTPVFRSDGVVVWCKGQDPNDYEIGVQFQDLTIESGARIIEEICHIEKYKQDAFEKDGRKLTSEEAAAEWISTHIELLP